MERRIRIGIDTGGTFTDVVAFDAESGEISTTKTPSTPANPAEGFMTGVDKILAQVGRDGGDVQAVSHGTTVATNDLLTDKIAHMGLITTSGYRHVLEIARQSVPHGYGNSYFWVKPDRIVPVDRVRAVDGRLDVDGTEVRPLDVDRARHVAAWFRDRGVDTIGVCLLHSYSNSAHEEQLRDILAEVHPDATISLSSEVLREYREYERTVTTLVDASVKPKVGAYINAIKSRLDAYTLGSLDGEAEGTSQAQNATAEAGIDAATAAHPTGPDGAALDVVSAADVDVASVASSSNAPGRRATTPNVAEGHAAAVPFYIMKSNGGVISAREVVHQPITTVLSGPAAGALGAAMVAGAGGWDTLLTLDGGGTSTDVSVVLDGEPTLTTEGSVGRFPSKIPMIDIVTVGAGGGSIAWISPEGTLKVGPESAGADPGPICYAQGGTEPTITDAHVMLGRIPPHLLGGEIPLDVEAARAGISDLAAKLGMEPEQCATGVLEISAFNQANAIRQVTVRRGLDVREFAMAAFGGSGPMLVCRLIDILGLEAVVVPRDPGNLSAFGLLTVDVKNDYVQTNVVTDTALDLGVMAEVFATLQDKAADALDREGFARADHRFQRTVDLRYDGQAFEVRVDAPAGPIDESFRETVVANFHRAHEQLYGYGYVDDERHPVEWVNLRVSGIGPITRPSLPGLAARDDDEEVTAAQTGTRQVHVDGWHDAPIFWRDDLRAGDEITGPAVLEEFGSTIPIHPGFTARVDEFANVVVTRDDTAAATAGPAVDLDIEHAPTSTESSAGADDPGISADNEEAA